MHDVSKREKKNNNQKSNGGIFPGRYSASDISRHGVEVMTAELTIILLLQILEVRNIYKQGFLLPFLQPSLLGGSSHASILSRLAAGKRGIDETSPLGTRATYEQQ
jgi:hypothetical protein